MVCIRAVYVLVFFTCLISQSAAQSNLEFSFFNSCSQQVEKHEFAIFSTQDLESISSKDFSIQLIIDTSHTYFLEVQIPRVSRDNFRHVFELDKLSKRIIKDTVEVPFLGLVNIGSTHNQNWVYMDCTGTVDGIKEYRDKSGIIRERGFFKEGKPKEISSYNKQGVLLSRSLYNESYRETKAELYDSLGNLNTYKLYIRKKRRMMILEFDASGKRIGKEVNKFQNPR